MSWGHACEWYKMKQICAEMEKVENIEAVKIDEDVIEFCNNF